MTTPTPATACANWTALDAHIRLMANPMHPDAFEDGCCCETCGCPGNMECGHAQLGPDCTLDSETLTCPCCSAVDALSQAVRCHIKEWGERQRGQGFLPL